MPRARARVAAEPLPEKIRQPPRASRLKGPNSPTRASAPSPRPIASAITPPTTRLQGGCRGR
eukprot:3552157-Pyramimonas_sp.AAC.1